jgi:hypothetical protein
MRPRKTYEGAFKASWAKSRPTSICKRAYPDFAALTGQRRVFCLAETLLRPLFEAIPPSQRGRSERAAAAREGSTA